MSTFRDDILEGRVALVTGGATGLGKEIARLLGEHGARVCIASRKREYLEAACSELRGEGIDCSSKRDVANAVLFLVSDAASYLTGHVVAVDGGAGIDMLKIRLPR